ncbi:MAG TPA: NAD(P)-dependent oxidoreductase [Candidatus Binatia bacterium]|nr:NAD(P)-dependent oxidoreductase [Candidatus Binatia bacterium]
MNILITGAGLIGAHLARRIVDGGDLAVLYDLVPNREYIGKVVGPDRASVIAADVRDLPALTQGLKDYEIDTAVHTAGLIGKRVAENTYTGSTNNILGTINVLEAARLMGLHRVVYVSTFGVYDRSKIKDPLIREDAATGGHNLYTVTKLCSEHLVHGYANHHNLDTIIIRPGGVFGRGHYVGGSTVGTIMRDLAMGMIKKTSLTIDAKVYGPNEYVYAKDVALALHLACKAASPTQRTYNAGSGVVTGPEELARIVNDLIPTIEVKVIGWSDADAKSAPLDLTASKAELGYTPQFSLKEALRNYMDELWSEGTVAS